MAFGQQLYGRAGPFAPSTGQVHPAAGAFPNQSQYQPNAAPATPPWLQTAPPPQQWPGPYNPATPAAPRLAPPVSLGKRVMGFVRQLSQSQPGDYSEDDESSSEEEWEEPDR